MVAFLTALYGKIFADILPIDVVGKYLKFFYSIGYYTQEFFNII